MATLVTSKSFTATGNGPHGIGGHLDLLTYAVSGTFVGTVILEKSSNGGLTWQQLVTVTGSASVTFLVESPDRADVWFRFRCSAYTSGTIVTTITVVPAVLPGGGVWGNISGTISEQTDLVDALALKAAAADLTTLTTTVSGKVDKETLTDNAIVRADGTAGDVQDSVVTIADTTGHMQFPAAAEIRLGGGSVNYITTTNGDQYLKLTGDSRVNIFIGGTQVWECLATRNYSFKLIAGPPGTSATEAYHAGGIVWSQYGNAGNVSTNETTVATYSAGANNLSTNGDGYFFRAWGAFAANGNNKRIRVYAGASGLFDTGVVTTSGGYFQLEGRFYRTGTNAQSFNWVYDTSSGPTHTQQMNSSALTSVNACVFTITALGGATDDIILVGAEIHFIPNK